MAFPVDLLARLQGGQPRGDRRGQGCHFPEGRRGDVDLPGAGIVPRAPDRRPRALGAGRRAGLRAVAPYALSATPLYQLRPACSDAVRPDRLARAALLIAFGRRSRLGRFGEVGMALRPCAALCALGQSARRLPDRHRGPGGILARGGSRLGAGDLAQGIHARVQKPMDRALAALGTLHPGDVGHALRLSSLRASVARDGRSTPRRRHR